MNVSNTEFKGPVRTAQ